MATATKKVYFVLRKGGQIIGGVRSLKEGVNLEDYKRLREGEGYTFQKVGKPPTLATLERWVSDGVAKSITGQRTEPDAPDSWVRVLGFI